MLEVTTDALDATFQFFAACGQARRECVAFWTGPLGGARVDQADHPRHRSWMASYEVDPHWLNEFWFRLADEGRCIHAQVHTHPRDAFHSAIDDVGAVGAHVGFTSIVVPDYGMTRSLTGARVYQLASSGWHLMPLRSTVRIVP